MQISKLFRERDPTQGSILGNALAMTTPLWIGSAAFIISHSLNTYWVSRLGTEAIAAVTIGGMAFMLMMVSVQGIVTATYGMMGSLVGQKDEAATEQTAKEILAIGFLLSLFLAALGYFSAPFLIKILGSKSGEVHSLATTYLRIQAVGGVVSLSFWIITGIVRSTRDFFRPMVLMCSILILQAIFDPFFILGFGGFPKLGVTGAALSLALAASCGTIGGFFILAKGKHVAKIGFHQWSGFRIRVKTLKEVAKLAAPDTLEGFTRVASQLVMLAIVAPFGTPVLAAYGIGYRLFRMSHIAGMDLGTTTAVTVSHNIGAGKIERAEKSTWAMIGLNSILMGTAALILFVFARQIIGAFSGEAQVLAGGVSYLRITAFGYIFFAAGLILRRTFAGAKDTITPMAVHGMMMGLQIGLAVILPGFFGLGLNGIWLAILIGMVLYGVISIVLFHLGYWKNKKQPLK